VALRPSVCYAALHNETEWGNVLQVLPEKLRELATWYREQAERTENPVIWDVRLRTAEELEEEAERIEGKLVPVSGFW
jgi:hypothetical protein